RVSFDFPFSISVSPSLYPSVPPSLHLRENRLHDISLDIGQTKISTLEFISQPSMINAQTMQDRRIQIVDVNRIARDVIAEIIRLANRDARFDSSAGKPHGKTARMMIAPVIGLGQLAL